MSKYIKLSIKEIHELLKNKEIKPIDLVNECIEEIEKMLKFQMIYFLEYQLPLKIILWLMV